MKFSHSLRTFALGAVCAAWLGIASAAPDDRIAALAAKEKPALLDTLKQLVSIESGSRDLEGLDKIANLIADTPQGDGRPGRAGRPDGRGLPHGRHAGEDRQGGARHLQGHGQQEDHADRPHGHGLPDRHAQQAALPHRRRQGLRPRHRRRQAGRGRHPAHGGAAEGAGLQGVRHADGADQRGRGDQLPGSRALISRLGARARRGDVVRGRIDQGGQALARHRRHRLGLAQRHGQGLARGLGARAGRERALRALAPDPPDARPVRSGHRAQDELDHLEVGHQPQRDPGVGQRRRPTCGC